MCVSACGEPLDCALSYLERLLRALRSAEGETVIRAAHVLGALRDPRAIGALSELWLSFTRRQGVEVLALEYLRVSAVTVPLVLAAALGAVALGVIFR